MLAAIRRLLLVLPAVIATGVHAAALEDIIRSIKPGVVGVGAYSNTRNPGFQIRGTGFAVGDGSLIATNAHVVDLTLDREHREQFAIMTSRNGKTVVRPVRLIATDEEHDLALLRLDGTPLPPLTLALGDMVAEGHDVAFMGFPIGAVLGFVPVTHRGMVSALTPSIIPFANSKQINAQNLRRLSGEPFPVYQLDATAYPGNSGSPMFDPDSGKVIGVVNMVLLKTTREAVLSNPSAISYAIPVKFLRQLIQANAGAH